MRDDGCSLDIRFTPDSRCEFRLRVDVPTAPYRRRRGAGHTSQMCDFAAAAVHRDLLQILLVELKRGAADRGALGQLQAGLDLIREQVAKTPAQVRPLAFLVANKHTAQLKHYLRSNQARLRFGSRTIWIDVRKCGDLFQASPS